MCREQVCRPEFIATLRTREQQLDRHRPFRRIFPLERPNFSLGRAPIRELARTQPGAVRAALDPDRGRGESHGLDRLRLWLRRRLEPRAPTQEAAIIRWSYENRGRAAALSTQPPAVINRGRARRIRQQEVQIYNELRAAGVHLPRLNDGPHGPEMSAQHEGAFLRELWSRGAFEAQPGSAREHWQRGASIRSIWQVLREEGYTYAGCFDGIPARSWHGWVRVPQ